MTETDVPDYDAMSPSDRAFALFTAVEAARSKAIAEMREAGRRINRAAKNEAHQAALAVWNAWAQPLLEEREALEKAGTWSVKNEFNAEFMTRVETGQNPETQDFLRRADINARSITFIGADWQGDGEEKTIAADTEPPVKTISCEDINLSSFSFPGIATFDNARFKGYADFRSAQFKGDADFRSAQFKGYADFSSAQIKGNADFSSAQVRGDAVFYSVQFKGNADFRSAQFKGYAYFSNAKFQDNASFAQVDFLSHANFSETVFLGGSNWTAINAVRAFDMAGARFETQVPQFTQAHFTESPRVDNVELPEPGRGHSTLPAPKPDTGWITKQVHSWLWAGGTTHDNEDSMRAIQAKWEKLEEWEELGDAPDGETRRLHRPAAHRHAGGGPRNRTESLQRRNAHPAGGWGAQTWLSVCLMGL